MTNKKWWQPKRPGNIFHNVMNIPTEAIRWLLNRAGWNRQVGTRDLAYYISHIIIMALALWAAYSILAAGQLEVPSSPKG